MAKTKGHGCTKGKPCAGMAYALDRPERRDRTGIEFAHTFNLDDGRYQPLGYVYRRTGRDNGIVFNRCPFCGVNLAALFPRKAHPTKDQQQQAKEE